MISLKGGISVLSMLLLVVGCKNSNNLQEKDYIVGGEIKTIFYNEIKINKEYIGKIIMEHAFDSIKLNPKDVRSKSLYLVQSEKLLSIEYLDKNKEDLPRFGEIEENNDTLYFTYEFKEEGEFLLEGLIDDAVFLDNYYGDGKGRLLNNLTKISEKVIVTK